MRVRKALVAAARGLWLAIASLAGSITLFTLLVVSLAFIPLGLGVLTTPPLLGAVRAHANHRRLMAARWSGVQIPLPYRPLPPDRRGGVVGVVERCSLLLKDPATWRDLLWLLIDMTAGTVVALLAFVLMPYGVEGWVLALGTWRPIVHAAGTYWYGFIPVTSQSTANYAALLGCGFLVLGVFATPVLLRAHFLVGRAFLAPTPRMTLAERVQHLTETRHDAVDTSAAELRRIERDLHDGAQARLVAMGMSLGTVEALMEKDPAKAKELLAAARASSAEALAELRDLVRGIHPPVLAERGLGDAVRALALRMPLSVEVEADLPGRADEPVESAAYFAISELLTNAAKHSGAERVWIDVHHDSGALRITVTDDGEGGASAAEGSGLSGVQRRLGTFDGVLAISSPVGGPTMVTIEIPCRLSAPRPTA
ncbi:sensor histidine kinase [Streptomyces sp. ME19-01-6]|uniref:sensor histidine kinase n=1 Tax=Streptomyces sp. ME19-01-6 TaxID=3028686 RepID=UPI0029BBC573|nr:sensor domain-containing protein [Streptomyces sp. ME19-01-6]MDX3232637.1 sensor domain-containing protein [Streptomyces sp. ME19-01-6]